MSKRHDSTGEFKPLKVINVIQPVIYWLNKSITSTMRYLDCSLNSRFFSGVWSIAYAKEVLAPCLGVGGVIKTKYSRHYQ